MFAAFHSFSISPFFFNFIGRTRGGNPLLPRCPLKDSLQGGEGQNPQNPQKGCFWEFCRFWRGVILRREVCQPENFAWPSAFARLILHALHGEPFRELSGKGVDFRRCEAVAEPGSVQKANSYQ